MNIFKVLWNVIKRQCLQMIQRPLYVTVMIAVPLFSAFFLMDLMKEGMAQNVPAAVVDMDQSSVSRSLTQTLGTMQTVKIVKKYDSYSDAIDGVKRGEVLGFFYIPEGFAEQAVAGRKPTLVYYTDYAYFVPASMLYKGFKTVSVLANGSLVKTALVQRGIPESLVMSKLQPIVTDVHPVHNPWLNYAVYLCNSFVPGVLALIVMLMTCHSVTMEIKHGTSVEWLEKAGGSMLLAVTGKLLPMTVVFTLVGWLIQVTMYGFLHYPLYCNVGVMMLAMFLMIVASQSFALFICCVVPNPRLSISVCSLVGMLAFSLCGFSFPVEQMYSWVQALSYMVPIRYYFLIYIDQGLNGIDIFYSRVWFAALLVFPMLPAILLKRLKTNMLNPVYVP